MPAVLPQRGVVGWRKLRPHLQDLEALYAKVGQRGKERGARTSQPFIGQIWNAGPNAEPNYDDQRYWVRETYLTNPRSLDSNDAGDVTAATQFAVMQHRSELPGALGRWVTATNILEIPAMQALAGIDDVGPHSVGYGTYVYCFASYDLNDIVEGGYPPVTITARKIRRWWFLHAPPPLVYEAVSDPYSDGMGHTVIDLEALNLDGSTTGVVETVYKLP